MKYLFFDIECSNCFNGDNKICEFGYVLTDQNFNVIKKEDIPMSPGDKRNSYNKFDVSIFKRDPNFNWAYDFDYYFECEKFPYFYKKIKNLLEDNDTMVFGFSVDNDVRYFGSEFKRYGLKPFKYKVCDIQIIMKYYSEKREAFMSLQDAFKKLCPSSEIAAIEPHLSRDDAYMSMRVLQEILKNLEMTVNQIMELCPDCFFDANEYLDNFNKRKQIKTQINENKKMWNDLCSSYQKLLNKEELVGKYCNVSRLIKEDKNLLLYIIDYIKEEGLVAYNKIEGSDFMIVVDENDKKRMINTLKKTFDGKFILYTEIKMKVKS